MMDQVTSSLKAGLGYLHNGFNRILRLAVGVPFAILMAACVMVIGIAITTLIAAIVMVIAILLAAVLLVSPFAVFIGLDSPARAVKKLVDDQLTSSNVTPFKK